MALAALSTLREMESSRPVTLLLNSDEEVGSPISRATSASADALTTRLLSVVSGEAPTQSASWLEEMSREAQERQTMAALGSEMQSSLRQVEKMLEKYEQFMEENFRNNVWNRKYLFFNKL